MRQDSKLYIINEIVKANMRIILLFGKEFIGIMGGKIKRPWVSGFIYGIAESIFINLCIIISFFYEFNFFIICLMVMVNVIFTSYFWHKQKGGNVLVASIVGVLSFCLTEMIIGYTDVVRNIFRHVYQTTLIGAGDGFGIMMMYVYNLSGAFIAALITIIVVNIKA